LLSSAEWGHFDRFLNIRPALALEYGRRLVTDDETRWALPDELRYQIEVSWRVQTGLA
jgi:hypothetical protein